VTTTIGPGRKALVTGAASGFGLAIARRLHEQGAAVGLLDLDLLRLRELADDLGDGALAVEADVRSPQSVADAVAACVRTFGGLDTLVVSAGVIHFKPLPEVTEEDWDRTLDVNLKGAFLCCQAASPHLRASGRGRIVTISSDAGRRGAPLIQAYAASKFGLVGLTESLAGELAADGVTANSVCPVACPTTSMGEQVLDWKAKHRGVSEDDVALSAARGNPVGRNATESDVAEAVLFFIAESSAFLTGVTLDVDGGNHLGSLPGMA
jgi:NAD(P)-dependent dehydrogenase (short-subunit alcohol dehydrogenase family)